MIRNKAPLGMVASAVTPRGYQRQVSLRAALSRYDEIVGRPEIEAYQLRALSKQWEWARGNVPFYQHFATVNRLPAEVTSLAQLEEFPVLTKQHLREYTDLIARTANIDGWISTGGSSGEPISIPRGKNEADDRYASNYVARSWAGVKPNDRYFHVWGHSHLFGTGLARHKNVAVRRLKDFALGAVRVPSYDQTLERATEYAAIVRQRNPVYVVGATSSVVRIASAISLLGPQWTKPRSLRSIIVTAEAASLEDVELIEKAFGVSCYVEYGAAETGVIAASRRGNSSLRVLWQSNHLWTTDDMSVRVTSLTDRAFPLINYSLDDRAKGGEDEFTVLDIESLRGREHELVDISRLDGRTVAVNCTGIVHAIKANSAALSVQIAQTGRTVSIGVMSYREVDCQKLKSDSVRNLSRSLGSIDENFIDLFEIESPVLSAAGKVKVLLEDSAALTERRISRGRS